MQAPAGGAALPGFDRDTVPDSGRQRATLTVLASGRYAVAVESRTGVALRLVDRMAGPGATFGVVGESDGRVDGFLDAGEIRVETFGPTLGRGEAKLSARPFVELSGSELPRLVEHRLVSTELGDYEQRSWWIEVGERRRVSFEAAGRHLADLRLWHAGTWLVDAEPVVETIAPAEGRPLTLTRLAADLAPGLYRLTAYGGPETPWARGGAEKPLHVRWGVPRRGVAAREPGTIGPFGFERFQVSGRATYFRLELPEARDGVAMEIGAFDEDDPLASVGATVHEITKETVPPVVEAGRERGETPWIVTVRGPAGQPYLLQHFAAERRTDLSGAGRYWIGTVHAGAAADSLDATGVLFAAPRGDFEHVRIEKADVVELSATRGWARRFNLLSGATLFLHVAEAGKYALAATGAAAEYRIEPLVFARPDGYEAPPLRPAPATWDLDPGYYVLSLVPAEAGIVEVALAAEEGAGAKLAPAHGAVRLGVVELAKNTSYVLWSNEQPGVVAGPIVRKLPLDLEIALPLSLAPGEEVVIPARAGEPSVAAARADDGSLLEIAVDAIGEWSEGPQIAAGTHRLRVRSRRGETVAATIGFEPVAQRSETPLPPLDPAALAALPELPPLAVGRPVPLDLERGATASFLFDAPEPALYLAETTGLLATEASLRTRVRPGLAEATENGSGRNAVVRAYLRPGDYQLTVGARGSSAGHLGVALRRATVADGGRLADGWPARATIPRDGAVAYRFTVERGGVYRLRALALGGVFDVRLEDADGYPVGDPPNPSEEPNLGDRALRLEPGEYRAVVLPRAVEARAVVRLDRLPEDAERAGHGPHHLALDEEVEHVWTEPGGDAPREPDVWTFTLPAPATVVATLSDEMEGEIVTRGPSGASVGAVPPGRAFRGELAAGDYALEARSSRRNHLAPYRVRVTTEELVAGVEREVATPASLALSLVGDSEIEIASFGDADVRAALFDAQGERVAVSDDRPNDWNFLLAGRFPAGRYRLRVDPVGAEGAASRVGVRVRPDAGEADWAVAGRARELEAGEAIRNVPLLVPENAELLAIGALAEEAVSLALDVRSADGWHELARDEGREPLIALPWEGRGEPLRLRVRALDGRPTAVRLSGFAGEVGSGNEKALASGIPLTPLRGFAPPLAVARIEVGSAGCFAPVADGDAALLSARRPGEAMRERHGVLVAEERQLWLAARGKGVPVAARRVAVGEDAISVALEPGAAVTCDLASGAGLVAIETTALAGDVLLRPLGPGEPQGVDAGSAVAPQRALAIAAGATRVEIASSRGGGPIEARVRARVLDVANVARPADGTGDFEIPAGSARRVSLGGTASSVRLALDRGLAALFDDGRPPIWAASGPMAARWTGVARELILANPGDEPLRARVEARESAQDAATTTAVARAAPFERRFPDAGTIRLGVEALPGGVLHVRGARHAVFVGADHTVGRGAEIRLGQTAGTLWIEHGTAPLVAWLEGSETTASARLEEIGLQSVAPIDALPGPAVRPLTGSRSGFAIEAASPGVLTLRAPTPAAAAVSFGDDARVELFPVRLAWSLAVPAGPVEVRLRGLAGAPLAGDLEVDFAPAEPAGKGLGPESLLAPGGAIAYRFAVTRKGMVGLGARSTSGAAEVELADGEGESLGRGVVLWRELEPGEYLLAVSLPPDAAPARVQPAIVGIAPPSTGPPEEAIRALVALERGEAVEGVASERAVEGTEPARVLAPAAPPESGDDVRMRGGYEEESDEEDLGEWSGEEGEEEAP